MKAALATAGMHAVCVNVCMSDTQTFISIHKKKKSLKKDTIFFLFVLNLSSEGGKMSALKTLCCAFVDTVEQ